MAYSTQQTNAGKTETLWWPSSGPNRGTAYYSEAAAIAAEGQSVEASAREADDEFKVASQYTPVVKADTRYAPVRTAPAPKPTLTWADVNQVTPEEHQQMVDYVKRTDPDATLNRSGATNRAFEEYHRNNQGGFTGLKGGPSFTDIASFVVDPIGSTARIATKAITGSDSLGNLAQVASGPVGAITGPIRESINFNQNKGKGGPQGAPATVAPLPEAGTGTPSQQTQTALGEQYEAEGEFDQVAEEGEQVLSEDRERVLDAINDAGRETTLTEESRKQQQHALDLQERLLNRILGFDPNAYAEQFADNALARQTALARSTPGGAAARQQGIFTALEQAPAIQAEAQRQAQQLENSRLQQAQSAVGKFGDLAFGVRAQDAAQEEFDAEFELQVVDAFQDIFDTDSTVEINKLNTYKDIYIETMRNTRGYAEMDSNERMALWREATTRYGLELDFDAKIEEIRKKYPDRDPLDVWLERFDKAGSAVIAAKTGGLF